MNRYHRASTAAAVAAVALTAGASAQTFSYAVDASTSAVTLDADLELAFAGDLRGTFDSATNPGGTRTIAGLFGDPGRNERVPLDLGLVLDLAVGGAAGGAFELTLDRDGGAVRIDALSLSVGAGAVSSVDLGLTLLFSTFRTVAPASLFLGGIAIPVPLGSVDVTNVTLTQSGAAAGTAVPGAAAGTFDVVAIVPAGLTFEVDLGGLFGGGGGPTAVGPVPAAVPIVGTLDLAACDAALTAAASTPFDTTAPPPVPLGFDDLPFDLPTVLPPGETANLLLSVALGEVVVLGALDVTLLATATDGRVERICDGVVNSTGVGASLSVGGSVSVGAEDLVLAAADLPRESFGYLLMSQVGDFVPGFGGSQGTLCLGVPCFRFSESVLSSGVLGEVSFAPDFGALPMGQQFLAADAWLFQYWYRDAAPMVTSNVTDALRVTFCR